MSHFVGLHSNATMLDKNSEIKNSEHKKNNLSPKVSKERRKSADDEQGFISQLNMFVRTRTDSGKQLSDLVCHKNCTLLVLLSHLIH